MPAVNLSLPANNPSANFGSYFYSHNNASSTPLNIGGNAQNPTYGATLTAFAIVNYSIAPYVPYNNFNLFDNLSPLSGYLIQTSGSISINNDNTQVFPATYVLRPGLNWVTVDRNALSTTFSDIFGATNLSKIRAIYGGYDGSDDGAIKSPVLYNQFPQTYLPDAGPLAPQFITSFKPGSSYLVAMKEGQTITFQYARKNQYIITDSGNTAPTGPGYIICCENGDRLTTGVEG